MTSVDEVKSTDLECGGRAKRRHRFGCVCLMSRRSTQSAVAASLCRRTPNGWDDTPKSFSKRRFSVDDIERRNDFGRGFDVRQMRAQVFCQTKQNLSDLALLSFAERLQLIIRCDRLQRFDE